MISIVGDEKKCLEDKEFRISLFNNPRIKVRENKSLNKWFNEIPKHVKKFNFEIEDDSQYKTNENTFYKSQLKRRHKGFPFITSCWPRIRYDLC